MKELFGGPGKVSGLVLRMGQCVFGVASIAVMASSHGFATCTAFWYYYYYLYFSLLFIDLLFLSLICCFVSFHYVVVK